MKLEQRFPAGPPITVEELLADLDDTDYGLTVGDDRVVDFLTRFARILLTPAVYRTFPELAPLGFFLRRREIQRILDGLRPADDHTLRFPRGFVFHVPPANVDTIFVYSWALAALTGNRNVVRISPRSGGAASAVLDALNEAATEADPLVARSQRLVTYDRDDAVTAALSGACDLRVIWGGDEAVEALRRHPLRPSARDITFPDRASFAAVSVAGWEGASAAERQQAVIGCVNDAYWFDQAACASPRTIFWVGDPIAAEQARTEFGALLRAEVARLGFAVEPGMAVHNRVSAYGLAAAGAVTAIAFDGNAAMHLELCGPGVVPRSWLGAGMFPHTTIAALDDLTGLIGRKDQTLSCFGFSREELETFVRRLAGRGIDRVVPFGSALAFSAVWDGYDLPAEFTRLVTLPAGL
jgi:hypothetical protein